MLKKEEHRIEDIVSVMAAPYPIRPGEADCRDYLRTGRCKYGESCKYHHPPNVESGGGFKPINPSEPLFPIRPTEPACQYFLKHGTCKFGQSCKFNHPSGSSLPNGGGNLPTGQLVFVTANTAPGAVHGDALSHMMSASTSVQVLPQRPTEPNCIYFLRNGKCKYGATCKFHHPLDSINRHNQVQHLQPTGTRPTQYARDRSPSAGSLSDGPLQMQQHGVTYAAASNLSFLQPQRLQPITERVRPQQPTHILLPDGQIAVILDSQSLQNVNELSAQDRPKFYMSQTDGSIGTLPSMEPKCTPVGVSPMLTATTNSSSNNTFDSSIDLGANAIYQGQPHDLQSRGPHKSGSGGNLSAYGSVDSCSHAQGDFSYQAAAPIPLQPNGGQTASFLPQFTAWPANEGLSQSNQAQVRRSPSGAEAPDRPRHVANLESTAENIAAYYWPSSGSSSSLPVTERDPQAGRTHGSITDSSPSFSNNIVGQAIHRSSSAETSNIPISLSASSERRRGKQEADRGAQESSGDDEGLTMMTSALLTMMDRHDDSPVGEHDASAQRSLNRSSMAIGSHNTHQPDDVYGSQSEPNLHSKMSPMRPPPGMVGPPGMSYIDSSYSSNYNQNVASSQSPRVGGGGGGYFVGGYDQPNDRSPPPPWCG